ncbi:hypothetical protein [Mycolicibacterium cosmeticum]|uniref:hypothetical protein n=1 Tax=Mycolicibacterium cosmeticum TaxID=258533 RepID=UPI003204AD29
MIGGLIGVGSRDDTSSTAPATVTVTAAAPSIDVSVPASSDPVCAEWIPLADGYRAKRAAWVAIDPSISAERWTLDQRAVNMAVIPTLRSEADDLRRFAERATNDLLATLMRSQAQYEDAYANRLPHYQPVDQRLWQAVTDFGNSVNSVCTVTGSR